jgi:hypothetical protein
VIGALHPDLEEAARRVLGARIVENILTSGPPVLTEALETVPDLLATGGVMFEIVFVDHLFGVGAGRPLESRVHAELRKAARGAGLVVQVKHPLPIRGEADVSAGATSYVRGAHLGRVHSSVIAAPASSGSAPDTARIPSIVAITPPVYSFQNTKTTAHLGVEFRVSISEDGDRTNFILTRT